ncbi:TetR/AcrR family transcriptional regulator [Vibrio sp. JC009]|uniref:TetR/AcrR family transcriptional regulator n=1 Tax=Vibrio sp. JC009 TaxID=2912314 RepID=UPI0023B01F02|nr:TetR/AcrR family transcriptional regulator [Vibrio sp. JC009]WED24744.1 TetR/AcrR family transcriptional regulator [Vibrio sp. JC009]
MSRGRPKNPELQEKTRAALLDAARTLLMEKNYSSITIRELAAHAGTQSGMISYYFGNKKGLFEAMLKQAAKNRQIKLASLSADVMKDRERIFEVLVSGVIDLLLEDRWLFKFFQDEVITKDSEIKPIIINEFSSISPVGLMQLFGQLQEEGVIRSDINLKYFIASFMSLIGFPIMSQPLLEEAVGIDLETVASVEWKQHISDLLKRSVA